MSNMSYCRFQNTRGDLADCETSLDAGDELSKDEEEAALDLIETALRIVERFSDEEVELPDREALREKLRSMYNDVEDNDEEQG